MVVLVTGGLALVQHFVPAGKPLAELVAGKAYGPLLVLAALVAMLLCLAALGCVCFI